MSETETCRSCGAALAADQRYCLNCGERRGGPRVSYRERVGGSGTGGAGTGAAAGAAGAGPPPPAGPEVPPPGGPERRQRDYAPLAAAGGIAVLGIMLLIGVLIGRGTGSTASEGQTPQVVTVESSGTKAGAGGDEAEASTGGGGDAKKANGGGSAKKAAKGGGKSASTSTGDAPVASDQELQQLQEQSPDEYQESSAKLPDEIATPGAAPPTDNKAPGRGEGGTTIE